ncbi:hypothetical protein DdX_19316 [Ditylenchus destructor]|uniref:Uncharacterized protein n=1 Tax=Ditylenchus destructor TaxID=166010 RepID=A0AAD4MJE5_9BILA|nr:hypothetical protein DdX_19316 [Ditylenchus destructor]
MTLLFLSIIICVSIPLAGAELDAIRGLPEGKPTKMTVLNPKLVEGDDGHTHLHFTGTDYNGAEKHFDVVIQYYIATPQATSQAYYHKDHISDPEKDKKYFVYVNAANYLVTGKHMNEWKAKYHQLFGWDFFE